MGKLDGKIALISGGSSGITNSHQKLKALVVRIKELLRGSGIL
jgi:NADP-dependent 3-hydroxy acid dehydrogenase YdfG